MAWRAWPWPRRWPAGQCAVPPGGLHHPEQAGVGAQPGHAFSVHGITGNLGWAAAPVFSIGLASAFGNWRAAYWGTAVVALAVLALVIWQRDLLDDRQGSWTPKKGAAPAPAEHPMAFLRLPSVWLCFSFFFFTTAALAAVQSFASPALTALYGLPLARTAFVVTGYMLCGAAGMVVGGFLLTRTERLERNIALAMVLAAGLLALAGSGWLPPLAAAAVTAVAGFGTGLAGPSRDMLIKQAAPPGPPAASTAPCTRVWTWALPRPPRCSAR
jgi:predicted MFS family arabinose efflux permease